VAAAAVVAVAMARRRRALALARRALLPRARDRRRRRLFSLLLNDDGQESIFDAPLPATSIGPRAGAIEPEMETMRPPYLVRRRRTRRPRASAAAAARVVGTARICTAHARA
jgi:hypothetical protein